MKMRTKLRIEDWVFIIGVGLFIAMNFGNFTIANGQILEFNGFDCGSQGDCLNTLQNDVIEPIIYLVLTLVAYVAIKIFTRRK